MATIPVPTSDCVGVDVTKNGRVIASYDAHNGYVNTDNRSHARLLERTFGSRKAFSLGGLVERPTRLCPGCARPNFADNRICPACNTSVEVVTSERS